MLCSLAPKELWLSAGMQHRLYLLQDGTIQLLCYTIVLGCIMNSKLLFSTILVQVKGKFLASVFATSVRVEGFYVSLVLGKALGRKVLVSPQGLTFAMQEVKVSHAGLVIHKSNIITAPTDICHRCRSPKVGMNFSAKFGSPLPLMLLATGLRVDLA